MTTVPYRFLNFYGSFFESTVICQNLKLLTEHKPAWNHVTRTPAKSQKRQASNLAFCHDGLNWGFGAAAKNLNYPETCQSVTLLLHTPDRH